MYNVIASGLYECNKKNSMHESFLMLAVTYELP